MTSSASSIRRASHSIMLKQSLYKRGTHSMPSTDHEPGVLAELSRRSQAPFGLSASVFGECGPGEAAVVAAAPRRHARRPSGCRRSVERLTDPLGAVTTENVASAVQTLPGPASKAAYRCAMADLRLPTWKQFRATSRNGSAPCKGREQRPAKQSTA